MGEHKTQLAIIYGGHRDKISDNHKGIWRRLVTQGHLKNHRRQTASNSHCEFLERSPGTMSRDDLVNRQFQSQQPDDQNIDIAAFPR